MNDVRSIHRFLAEDSEDAAARVVLSLISSVQRLVAFPSSGRIVPDYEGSDVREVIRRPYKIVYRIVAAEVRVLRVFHGARLVHPGEIEAPPE